MPFRPVHLTKAVPRGPAGNVNRDPIIAWLEAEGALQPALVALADNDATRARDIALAVLAQAEAAQDHHRRAKSMLLLGHIDRLVSRFLGMPTGDPGRRCSCFAVWATPSASAVRCRRWRMRRPAWVETRRPSKRR